MHKEPKYGALLNSWERLNASLETNAKDFSHLEEARTQLLAMLSEARALAEQQAVHAASKQDASKRLRTLLLEGRKTATFLRGGIRQRYGTRAEKLVEFGLAPFRGRPRKTLIVEVPAPAVPAKAE